MNREEAKLLLQSYRSNGQDADDPQFAEALTLAKNDSELAAWFAEQQKFDAMVSSGLQKIAAPSQLKSQILARGQKSARPETFAEPPVANWWRNLFSFNSPVAWAAAIILIFICLGIFWEKPGGQARFADFSARMVFAAVNDTNHVDAKITDMKQVAAWLAERHGENKFVLPVALNGKNSLMGCRVLDWHGQKVSMLCYLLKDSGHMDLFVADAKIFSDAPPDRPQFATSGGMPTASWSRDGLAYLIVGHGNESDLEKILQLKAAVAMRLSASISL
jgi:anti-sigma factor RsiW